MSELDTEALQATLRQKFRAFVRKTFSHTTGGKAFHHNWHIDAAAEMLTAVKRGEIRRLLITLPPRSLKSSITSVAFPAWMLGHRPSHRIIGASYGLDLANGFARQTRDVMSSSWYRQTFPGTVLSKDKQTETEFHTTMHGSRYAVSTGGPLTGLGADLIIVDDPIKAAEGSSSPSARQDLNEWFGNTLVSRLNDQSTGAIIVTMQRLHLDDLVGFLWEQGGWEHLSIPAEAQKTVPYRTGPAAHNVYTFKAGTVLDPVRAPKKILDELRVQMGKKAYAAQMLQEPIPDGGTIFDWKWFKFYDQAQLSTPKFDFVFQSWDVASSISENADYSVCTTWGVVRTDEFYLIDVVRVRLGQPSLIDLAHVLHDKYHPDIVLIETTGLGLTFWQVLRAKFGNRFIGTNPKGDKVVRAEAQTGVIEQGRVFIPREATWLEAFRKEIIGFPGGKHNDQVDSFVQFLTHAARLINETMKLGRRHHTDRDFDIPRTGAVVTVKLLGARQLRSDWSSLF